MPAKKANGLDILFLNQSMTDLDLFGTMGAFLCMIDGINYILHGNFSLMVFKLCITTDQDMRPEKSLFDPFSR